MTDEAALPLSLSGPTTWDQLAARGPLLAATMRRYIAQQTVTLAPSSIVSISNTLVRFGVWIIEHDPAVRGAADIGRPHIEAFKIKCITDVHFLTGQPLATNTIRQRLRLDEGVLRPDHRLGVRRRTEPQPDHPRRRPATSRAAPEVPR